MLSTSFYSQEVNVDSLEKLLKQLPENKEKIYVLHDLFLETEFTDTVKARYYVNEAIRISERIKDSVLLGVSYRYNGWLLEDNGSIIPSLKMHQVSAKIFEKLGDKQQIADSYGNIGNMYEVIGNYGRALEYQHKSLNLNKEILMIEKDSSLIARAERGLSYATGNLGNIYKLTGDLEKALEFQLNSLEMEKEANNLYGIAVSYSTLGIISHNQNKFEEAKAYLNESLKIGKQINNYADIMVCYLSLSVVAEKENKLDLALAYLDSSVLFAEKVNDRFTLGTVANNRANIYFKQHKTDESEKMAFLSLGIANEIQSIEKAKHAYLLLSDINVERKKFDLALDFYKKYIVARDSLFSHENKQDLRQRDLELEFEGERMRDSIRNAELQLVKDLEITSKTNEIAKQNAEIDKEKTLKTALFGGLGLVLFIAVILFRGIQRKKKDHEIISQQKDEVEKQRDVANQQKLLAEEQTSLVEEKNKEITDSINYAKRIQAAILPSDHLIKEYLQNSFILYNPKDIVAGDFYWMDTLSKQGNQTILFAAADCTGHGVPGAMVSVVCHNALNRSVREYGLIKPSEILDKTADLVIEQFDKSSEDVKDGMDIALCSLQIFDPHFPTKNINPQENSKTVGILEYSGANNPLWIIRNNEVIEIKATKQPIGKFDQRIPFENHSIELEKGDAIYIFSDGYIDQFGGDKGKKFKSKAFRELILSIQDKSMLEQKKIFENVFETWRGEIEQIDDVCIIGVLI